MDGHTMTRGEFICSSLALAAMPTQAGGAEARIVALRLM